MPTKPIDRLLFAQGGRCFFCQQVLSPTEASVEHLVATSNGGSNDPDNTVACCTTLNKLLGSMSLKEKIRVVLNQKGEFQCPNGARRPKAQTEVHASPTERLALVIEDLRKRGAAKPRTVRTLGNTINAVFQKALTEEEVDAIIGKLTEQGIVTVAGTKVSYVLPPCVT